MLDNYISDKKRRWEVQKFLPSPISNVAYSYAHNPWISILYDRSEFLSRIGADQVDKRDVGNQIRMDRRQHILDPIRPKCDMLDCGMTRSTRRRFLQCSALSAGWLLAGRGRTTSFASAAQPHSRVAQVTDGSVWVGRDWTDRDLDYAGIKNMLQKALCTLAGGHDCKAALATLIPQITDAAQRFGIKTNCVNPHLPTHPKVVSALVELLVEAGADADNIIVFDREDYELTRCGYAVNLDKGFKVYGTSHPGIGYDPEPVETSHGAVRFSSILTRRIDHLINVPVLKNHQMAGVTLALKNHFGCIDQPQRLHGINRDCRPGIAEINSHPSVRAKTRLVVIDALFATHVSGLQAKPDFAPMTVMAACDPVAADSTGKDLINARRKQDGLAEVEARHILDAAALGLGNADPNRIERLDVLLHPVKEKAKPWLDNKPSGCHTTRSTGGLATATAATGTALLMQKKRFRK